MQMTPRRFGAAGALFAFASALACAPKTAPPAPAAAPVAAPPTVMQTCPDPTDGPSIVINAVEEAHRVWVANPTTPLPPPCVFGAFARITSPVSDSLNDRALALAAELRRRGSNQPELLAAEIVFLARARRYADVSRTYDRLVAMDSQPPIEVSRLAIAAARQRADTATLLRVLARTAPHPAAGPSVVSEQTVLRQAGALWAAINEARGLVRQNPRYVAAYPSLVGNFGTLGLADSVVVYVRRALAQGAARATLTPSVELLVSTMLRHATLYGSTYGWGAQIAAASRVDSALSSPATKFLVAALIIHSAEPRIAEISALVSGASRLTDAASREQAARRRTAACERIAPLTRELNVADAHLRGGGDRYSGRGVAQFTAGLAASRSRLTELQEQCSRPAG
jgi:hypothetical protein